MSTGSMVDITTAEQRIAERVDPRVTGGLAVSTTGTGVTFSNVGEMMEFAKMMSVANTGVRKHLRGNPGACLAILTQALEWGMSPFAIANKSYFVNEQIAFESQLIQGVILKRAPITGRIKFRFAGEGDSRVCIASATLKDGTGDVEYESPKFSKIQPKNSPLWKSDPDQQHCYYSGRALCRRHFPDVLLGIYDIDEFSEDKPVGAEHARDVTPAPRSISAKLDAIAATGKERQPQTTPSVGNHDPETGEIQLESETPGSETAAGGAEGALQEAGTAAPDQGEPDGAGASSGYLSAARDDPAKAQLMQKLRTKAQGGTGALRRALHGLVPVQNEMLTHDDHDALGDIAEKADQTRETADASAGR